MKKKTVYNLEVKRNDGQTFLLDTVSVENFVDTVNAIIQSDAMELVQTFITKEEF